MQENTTPQSGDPVKPYQAESFIVPPVAVEVEKEKQTSVPYGPVIISAVFILLILGGGSWYTFSIMPRQNAVRLVDQIKPHVTTLKSSTSDVIDNMNTIYKLATEQSAPPPAPNMQTTGIRIQPNIASLANTSAVLGAAISRGQKALVENQMQEIAVSLRGAMRTMTMDSGNVAGVSTSSEDANASTFRLLKTETVKTGESVRKAQAELSQLIILSSAPKGYLQRDAKAKITSSETLKISAKGYFSEASKIAAYYETLSDIVIAMNTKITSFKSAIASAGSGFGSVLKSGDSASAKTTLSQVQVFLNQADSDMKDMKALSEKLNAVPNESLPMSINDYHTHNKKILDAATTYFTVQTGLLQNLVTGAKNIVDKSDQNTLTVADMAQFQNQMTISVSQSALSDAKFVSDLQTLQGEEGSLAVSFWQNNSRLGDGVKVAEAVNAYQASLDKLRQENTVQGFVK